MIMQRTLRGMRYAAVGVLALMCAAPLDAAAPESKRMSRAKDFIADEQWVRAIEELRAAAGDAREPARDEALFWLAHSQNQAGDRAAAVETIRRLERQFPKSRWTKPAGSLRIEIAQRLRRHDVLWMTASPPQPSPPGLAPPPPAPMEGVTPGAAPQPRRGRGRPAPPPLPAEATGRTPPPAPPAPMPPPEPWFGAEIQFDTELRIQALGSLIRTDAAKAIPLLKQIAIESENFGDARRAVVVLALSGTPDARSSVVEVAKLAPEPVRIAAIRELGRFGGGDVARELLQVYATANAPVKHQVVTSLGERAETAALLRIAESEADRTLRERAVVTLGRAGGHDQLRQLYAKAGHSLKRAIIIGLFNARAASDLRRIAEAETDPALRRAARYRLRLLGGSQPSKREPKHP